MQKNFYKFLQYSVVLTCLSLIAKIIMDEREITQILVGVNFYKFIPAIFLSIFITLFFFLFLRKVLSFNTSIKITPRRWLYIFLNSQFLDTIPFAGFFYKALRLKQHNLDYKFFLYSYLLIFIVWMVLYLFLFFLDLNILSIIYMDIKYFYISIIFFILSFLIYFSIFILEILLKKINLKQFLLIELKDLIFYLRKCFSKKKNFKPFIKYGVLIHIFEFTLYLVIIEFLEIDISIKSIFLIFLVNSVVDFFPITPKNIGFSELISGGLLSLIGFNFTTGVLIKVFIRFSSIISTTMLFFLNNVFYDNEKNRYK